MGCSALETVFKGFSIEIAEANITLAVVNTFGYPVTGAQVTLDSGFRVENEITDEQGIVQTSLPSDVDCQVTVSKNGYQLYTYPFMVVNKNDFNASANFPVKVKENASLPGVFVNGAAVQMTYAKPGFPSQTVAVNEQNGIYEAVFKYGYTNTIEVDAGVLGSFSQVIETFVKVDCGDTEFRIVPIITI